MGSSIAWFSTQVRRTAGSARVSRLSVSYDYDRTHCKKSILKRRKLQSLDKEKSPFSQNTKVFIKKNLTLMNENVVFNGRKLKWTGLVHLCFTSYAIARIKIS